MKEQLEDILRALGATDVRIDFGPDAYVEFDTLQGEPIGWNVIDNRRRYPHQVAANLTIEDAARLAKGLRT